MLHDGQSPKEEDCNYMYVIHHRQDITSTVLNFLIKFALEFLRYLLRRELTASKKANNNLRKLDNTAVDLGRKFSPRRPIRICVITASRLVFTEVISIML
jgi:hypothetical protein